jgi:hypothetical protein
MFNLSEQAGLAQAQERGIEVSLVDPNTGQDTGATITIAGLDSRRAREARRSAWRHVISQRDEERPAPTDDERRTAATRMLAGCVISWTGFTRDGEEAMECILENVLAVFEQVPWVEDECDLRVGNRANFTNA